MQLFGGYGGGGISVPSNVAEIPSAPAPPVPPPPPAPPSQTAPPAPVPPEPPGLGTIAEYFGYPSATGPTEVAGPEGLSVETLPNLQGFGFELMRLILPGGQGATPPPVLTPAPQPVQAIPPVLPAPQPLSIPQQLRIPNPQPVSNPVEISTQRGIDTGTQRGKPLEIGQPAELGKPLEIAHGGDAETVREDIARGDMPHLTGADPPQLPDLDLEIGRENTVSEQPCLSCQMTEEERAQLIDALPPDAVEVSFMCPNSDEAENLAAGSPHKCIPQ